MTKLASHQITVAEVADVGNAGISETKRQLLQLLLAKKRRARETESADRDSNDLQISRRQQRSPAPLSFAQHRLWFIDQLDPGTPIFNIPAAIRMRGPVRIETFERSIEEIIRRHETLRTTFGTEDGQPVQIIAEEVLPDIPVVDLQALASEEEQLEVVRALVTQDCQRSFDLAQGPLLRTTVVRLGDGDHVLIMMLQHIVGDVWSVRLFMKELAHLYQAFLSGEPSPLPELPVQYADYAVWQRNWLQGEALEEQLRYWKGQLGGMPEELNLPLDRPRPPVQSIWGAKEFLRVDRPLSERVRAIGRQVGASPFMTFVAAWKVLLLQYTKQDDIVVGVPAANRSRSEVEKLVGFFVNSVVLRTDLSGNPTFRELVARQRDVTLGAFAHQEFPFERLVELLQPERTMSRNPLFQTDVVLQNAPMEAFEVPSMTFEPLPTEDGTAQLDMTLDLWEDKGSIGGWLEYDTDLFDRSTAQRIVRHYVFLLESIAERPDRPIGELPAVSAAHRQQLLVEWNFTPPPVRRERVHRRFEALALEQPEAPAVVAGDDTLTYGELERRASALAQHLHRSGIGPDRRVAICLQPSTDRIAAVLGVLKAGGAYVPLDPDYSSERLAFILKDCGAELLLTTRELVDGMTELAESSVSKVYLEDVSWENQSLGGGKLAPGIEVDGKNLAYVVYTSGSTGRPKGVMVSHEALDNAYRGWEESYRLRTAASRHLQMASFSFDVFTGDLVRALCSGGCLVLCPRELLLDPPLLWQLLEEQRIDAAEFVPAVVRSLVQHLHNTGGDLARLRLMVVGSDVWTNAEMATVQSLASPQTRVISSYGVSEATIDSSAFEDEGFPLSPERTVPIGRPFHGTRLLVLSQGFEANPMGIAGELVIGGENLARGYHGRPSLTAEKFVPDPFATAFDGQAGGRLYRTGDLARFLPNGQMEFLGRTDFQVKIRGYRVEPGEIESILEEHPSVRQAVVVARSLAGNELVLAAYLLAMDNAEPEPAELRRFLGERLPQYMVPSAMVVVEELPLTPNGKVDRKALPALDGERLASAAFVAPRNTTETILARLWEEILEIDVVGVEDNLFEIGAHSLLLTQVISRTRRELGVAPPLRAFFEDPTVAGMARAVERQKSDGAESDAPPLVPIPRDRPLPLSFTQERMWFLDQLQPGLTAYNVPGAVWMDGALDFRALEKGLSEVLRRHEIFRTTYGAVAGRPVQIVHSPKPFSLPLVDLTGLPEELRDPLAQEIARAGARLPFDLEKGPMLRAALVRCGSRAHRLAMTTHHIAYDMWARDIFINELGLLYVAYGAGRPSLLPEPRLQFADFAAWQRQWLQGEVLERQLAYWRQKLENSPRFLELPTDKARPPVQSFIGKRQYILLRSELAEAAHALSRRLDTTPFITVLAAFKVLLQRYSGSDEILVGSPIANRGRVELEEVMGFLANTVVLATDLSGDPTFRELLGRVRETSVEAHSHQDVPFEMLVQELAPERDMSRSPLFQVMFNFMLHYKPPKVELPDLRLEVETLHGGGAQCDINIDMFQSPLGLHGVVEYATDVYCDSTITRMMRQFETLLGAAVEDPQQRLSRLPLLPAAQRLQLVAEWNDTAGTREMSLVFPEAFRAQAARSPAAVAATCDGESLTYRELAQRAGGIADFLEEQGVGRDSVVPLLAKRNLDLLVAILGVLEVGAAYLPLDPHHPAARHARILEQSGARLVLAELDLAPLAAEACAASTGEAATVVVLEDLVGRKGGSSRRSATPPESLAYVLFTSGSTGLPKGVMVHHAGLMNHLWANLDRLEMGSADVLAQTAHQCFDISVWQFLAPLLVGGRVEIFPDEVAHDPRRLLRAVDAEGITVLETVPSLLQLMLPEEKGGPEAPALSALRWLLPTGEALPVPLQRRWLDHYPDIPLVNAYGPSECSDDVTLEILRLPLPGEVGAVPIGRPVVGLTAYVLDRALRTQGIGMPGEICVGGVGVGRGYLGDARRTASVFVPDPFVGAGQRMYRSGDLGRTLPEGRLEYLGRLDFQVKVRGFRIELGEIEATLGRHPAVRETVVAVRDVLVGEEVRDPRLVAYVVAAPEEDIDLEALKEFLGEHLPAYMAPSAMVVLDALPLTRNGKVDRDVLPEPSWAPAEQDRPFVGPRDAEEERLAAIFQEVLGLDAVSVDVDFFDMGGHSLLAIQVLSRIRDSYGVAPPLRTLFETSTVAGMAQVVRAIHWAALSLEEADSSGEEEEGVLQEEGVL